LAAGLRGGAEWVLGDVGFGAAPNGRFEMAGRASGWLASS
jgi:hypothetical protein